MLTPLPAADWDDNARGALASMLAPEQRNPRGAGNALATLVRHPELTQAYLPFNVYLLAGSTLPPRLRELAILRVAHRQSCAYEWGHHVELGKQAGLSESEIAAVRDGHAGNEFERTVLTAVDELHEKSRISPDTWTALGEQLRRPPADGPAFHGRRLRGAGDGAEHLWRRTGSRGASGMTDFDTVDFFRDERLVADPYPYFEALRAKCPVTARTASRRDDGDRLRRGGRGLQRRRDVLVVQLGDRSVPRVPGPARGPRYQT